MKKLNKGKIGKKYRISKVSGNDKTRSYLYNLGFHEGEEIMIMSKIANNIIINVLDTRYGLDADMAKLIEVELCE